MTYAVANRAFGTYEEAFDFCNVCDFDFDTMIEVIEESNQQGANDMQTKDEFMQEAREELGQDFSSLVPALDTEYYEMVITHVKQGKAINKKVYDSLSDMQKFHFNKHYNYRNDKVA